MGRGIKRRNPENQSFFKRSKEVHEERVQAILGEGAANATANANVTQLAVSEVAGGSNVEMIRSGSESVDEDPESTSVGLKKAAAAEIVRGIKASKDGVFNNYVIIDYPLVSVRSPQYKYWSLLCHVNTHHSAGYILCKYAGQKGCSISSGPGGSLRVQNTSKGTSTMKAHTSALHPEKMDKGDVAKGSLSKTDTSRSENFVVPNAEKR